MATSNHLERYEQKRRWVEKDDNQYDRRLQTERNEEIKLRNSYRNFHKLETNAIKLQACSSFIFAFLFAKILDQKLKKDAKQNNEYERERERRERGERKRCSYKKFAGMELAMAPWKP